MSKQRTFTIVVQYADMNGGCTEVARLKIQARTEEAALVIAQRQYPAPRYCCW